MNHFLANLRELRGDYFTFGVLYENVLAMRPYLVGDWKSKYIYYSSWQIRLVAGRLWCDIELYVITNNCVIVVEPASYTCTQYLELLYYIVLI